ncbi:DUF1134 domain-containing protein [Bartonella alsatica]|uniref:DUF1134 domain-containing protein n=2 Tax=Bartonella alsatica TaxID=52764 RepID=J1IWL9_9HYPH|nr:EipA family protein [Bartonella alsatica]EJF75630.1 hypothetical protein MEC_00185 [Bartonella alsatica IBS 382]QLC51694.1 DUF1134 domain-containing protein [Bartonella alsatica]
MALSLLTHWYKSTVSVIFLLFVIINTANAQLKPIQQNEPYYSLQEIIDSGHIFFGKTTGGIAAAIQNIFSQYGYPNAYILGEEASGAFFAGLTYGEGEIFTKIYGQQKVFWQGPSVGWDFGGQGSRLMILVYDLNNINNLWGRYGGISGSAYLIAGVGFHVLKRHNVLLVPIRTGIGARLGINVGYLKLTPKPTWNPF